MVEQDPVTLGELGRRFDRFEQTLQMLTSNFLTMSVWSVEKRAIETTLSSMGREIGELRGTIKAMDSEKEAEHKELLGRITDLKDQLFRRESEVRKEKAQRYFAIALAVLAAILGIIGTVVAATLNAAVTGGTL